MLCVVSQNVERIIDGDFSVLVHICKLLLRFRQIRGAAGADAGICQQRLVCIINGDHTVSVQVAHFSG